MQDVIFVPDHRDGQRAGRVIAATFHTHPHSEEGIRQEPSLMDVLAIQSDLELEHVDYEGEYVISRKIIYLIRKDGTIETVGGSLAILGIR